MKEIVIWVGEAWKVEEGEEDYTLEYLEQCNKSMWENLHDEDENREED